MKIGHIRGMGFQKDDRKGGVLLYLSGNKVMELSSINMETCSCGRKLNL